MWYNGENAIIFYGKDRDTVKFIHLSDLHLGKRLNEFSLLEDQRYILQQILDIAAAELPDAAFIAGDIYDKSIPSAEAVALFDDFLYRLSELTPHVFIISGNHDSAERLAFAGRLLDRSGIHLSPVWDGAVTPVTLTDVYGEVDVFMLPFIKKVQVEHRFPDAKLASCSDALAFAISKLELNPSRRNVLLSHQFVTGALRSDSEDVSVGGADNVDAAVFDAFDYAALGHLHAPQQVLRPTLRYCGTPLKYSFSEADQEKSVTSVELHDKGEISIRVLPLLPLRDLRELRGSYMELTSREFYINTRTGDYLHITLTDEDDIPDAVGKLRAVYPNIMRLDYDNTRTRSGASAEAACAVENKSPSELFCELYERQNGRPMTSEQLDYVSELIKTLWRDAK
jgi:exonuclease SbcD